MAIKSLGAKPITPPLKVDGLNSKLRTRIVRETTTETAIPPTVTTDVGTE